MSVTRTGLSVRVTRSETWQLKRFTGQLIVAVDPNQFQLHLYQLDQRDEWH